MNQERDKFLTEAMGICFWDKHNCSKCTLPDGEPMACVARRVAAINFSTPDSFFKLWNWTINRVWWHDFLNYFHTLNPGTTVVAIINPDKFANCVHDYLKYRQHPITILKNFVPMDEETENKLRAYCDEIVDVTELKCICKEFYQPFNCPVHGSRRK